MDKYSGPDKSFNYGKETYNDYINNQDRRLDDAIKDGKIIEVFTEENEQMYRKLINERNQRLSTESGRNYSNDFFAKNHKAGG